MYGNCHSLVLSVNHWTCAILKSTNAVDLMYYCYIYCKMALMNGNIYISHNTVTETGETM